MNNYNPLFNTMNLTRSFSPFPLAGSSITNALANTTRNGLFSKIGTSKISLSSILNGAQKTIGTVNQVVPLYNQVKPLFQNSKVLLNVAKSVKGNNQSRRFLSPKRRPSVYEQVSKNYEKQEQQIIIKKKENQNSPSKPFFIN